MTTYHYREGRALTPPQPKQGLNAGSLSRSLPAHQHRRLLQGARGGIHGRSNIFGGISNINSNKLLDQGKARAAG